MYPLTEYIGSSSILTSKERQMLTTTKMMCLRKAAGKTRNEKLDDE